MNKRKLTGAGGPDIPAEEIIWRSDCRRRSQQSKGRSKRVVSAAEQECIQKTLLQILQQSPKAILSACFESLSYNSGELYEAAIETLKAFLRDNSPTKNGETQPQSREGSALKKAISSHDRLSNWLATEIGLSRGKCLWL